MKTNDSLPPKLPPSTRKRLERLSRVMDTRFVVPGTDFRFGLDAVIGLLPVIGDGASAGLSTYPLWIAHRHGFSLFLKLRMIGRILIDLFVGMIPGVGDVFDAWYKCIRRNVEDLLCEDDKRTEISRAPVNPS